MKKLLLLKLLLLTTCYGFAQTTYDISYAQNAGYPGGVRPTSSTTTETTGWTTILPGSAAANAWTPPQTLPFAFSFFGQPVTNFKASANMLVTFDVASTALPNANTNLPTATLPDNTIAAFWDEFTNAAPTGSNDVVHTRVFGTAPNRQLWIVWFSFEYGNPNISFAYNGVVLEETTNKVYVVNIYNNGTPTLTTTVGLQQNSTNAVQFGTNQLPLASNINATVAEVDYYEFLPRLIVPTDAGVVALLTPATSGCYTAAQPVEVTIKNFGTSAISNVPVGARITGGAAPQTITATYSGTLAPNATANIVIGNANMAAAGTYTIKPYTALTGDGFGANDTLTNITRIVEPVIALPQIVNLTGFTGSNLTTVFPNWKEQAGATVPSGTASTWASSTGLGGATNITARINLWSTGKNEWIVGPKVAATAQTFFKFKAAITDYFDLIPYNGTMDPDDKVQVMVSTNCGQSFTPVFTLEASNTSNLTNVLTEYSVPLSTYAGQQIIIAIKGTEGATSGGEDYDFHIDDLAVVDIPPIDLGATALTSPVVNTGCYGNAEPVSFTIRNFGSQAIDFAATPATVTVNVTGAATQTFPLTLSNNTLNGGAPLAANATLTIPLGTLNMQTLGTYTFNGNVAITGDAIAANNAIAAANVTVAAPTAGTISTSMANLCVSGATTLTLAGNNGGNIQWQQATTLSGPYTDIAGETGQTYTTGTLTATSFYQAVVSCGSSSATATPITITVNNPQITAFANDTLCAPGIANLSATPSTGATIGWYSAATGGTPLATGNTYAPNVTATTTFYAEAIEGGSALNFGLTATGAYGSYGSPGGTGYGLALNFAQPGVITQAYVYPVSAGNVVVQLYTRAGIAVGSPVTVAVTAADVGNKTLIPLNIPVPAAGDYNLVNDAGSVYLNRYNPYSGPAFPFVTGGGLITIQGGVLSANGAPTTTTYYSFFDLIYNTGCSSVRTPVTAAVNPLPATPTITRSGAAGHTLTSSATTGNQWLLNGTPIPGATAQTYTATANGNYTVVVTTNGCASGASASVNITNTGIKGDLPGMSVSVYPNPNNGQFNVKLIGYNQDAALELYSLTGQLIVKENVKAGKQTTPMQVKNLAAGTYLLKVVSEKGVQISKLIVE